MRSPREPVEREQIGVLSLSHGDPALRGSEDRVEAARETERVQPGMWKNRESRLLMDKDNFAGTAGNGCSKQREQYRKGSDISIKEPYLERSGREEGKTTQGPGAHRFLD